jgi:hypothetical protein
VPGIYANCRKPVFFRLSAEPSYIFFGCRRMQVCMINYRRKNILLDKITFFKPLKLVNRKDHVIIFFCQAKHQVIPFQVAV